MDSDVGHGEEWTRMDQSWVLLNHLITSKYKGQIVFIRIGKKRNGKEKYISFISLLLKDLQKLVHPDIFDTLNGSLS